MASDAVVISTAAMAVHLFVLVVFVCFLLIFTNLVFQILNSSYTHLLSVIYSIYFKYRSNPQSKPVIRIYKSLINLLNSNKNKNYSK